LRGVEIVAVTVRFFASLKERLGVEQQQIDASDVQTVADVWNAVVENEPLPSTALVALNLEYVQADAAVKDGDEVAFFPPVTGG